MHSTQTQRRTHRGFLFLCAILVASIYPIAGIASAQEVPTEEQTTQEESAEPELTYTYNPDTGHWDSEKWVYNPETGVYEAPPAPPEPTIIEPKPIVEEVQPAEEVVQDEATSTRDTTVDSTVKIDNELTSVAVSGDATVAANFEAGSALTGDATVDATLVNMVNSSLGADENQKVATFTQDIYGDVQGDIILYPMLLKAMLEAEAQQTSSTIEVKEDFEINNNMVLSATSGDATVTKNTVAGDAETGSAYAVANVVNILNSMIASQQSFIGTMNIYGDLEGDILIAPDFIPQLLASNGGEDSSLKVSQEDTQTIVNNITTVAESGAASVLSNTSAGNAITGDALSNVVIFNISGHDIIASNSLLVFVNVLGQWVGVIVDAPAGATAALIGNGVTEHNYTPDLTVSTEMNKAITNTIAVSAESGAATVSQNTSAGNAVTGQAKAMANVANLTGSQMGLSGWFGVLFINVFQNWYGSFGINTPYGNPVAPTAESAPTGPVQFVPATTSKTVTGTYQDKVTLIDVRTVETTSPLAVIVKESVEKLSEQQEPAQLASASVLGESVLAPTFDYRLWIVAGSLILIGLSVAGIRALLR